MKGIPSLFGARSGACVENSFHTIYWKTFDLVKADTDELRQLAFKLRYDVFCNHDFGSELFERTDCFTLRSGTTDDTEKDSYDHNADHYLLMHRKSGNVAGTVRVVHFDADTPIFSFPLQEVCDHPFLHEGSKEQRVCEISRLCMAPQFRKRDSDGRTLPAYTHIKPPQNRGASDVAMIRRRIPFAPLGLMMAAFESALSRRTMNCVLAMDPSDFKILRSLGVVYKVLGPRLSNYGNMQPVVFNVKAVLDHMAQHNRPCWEVISRQGVLHEQANELALEQWSDSIFGEDTRGAIFDHVHEREGEHI